MANPENKHPVPNSFYRAFEDRFRGSQELIRDRLEAYVPFLRVLAAEHGKAKGLDLGCGRGEWLRILGREGIEAKGVDLDQGMLDAAQEHGLEVECKDVLQALSETADGSLALVTGFHLIEHLPFGMMLSVITEARRVLRPGGLLILETPNAENVLVGTWSFYLDPTHISPIPPLLMPFLAEYCGFSESTILRLNADKSIGGASLTDVFTKVSVDYSLVARTAGNPNVQMDELFKTTLGLDIFGALHNFDVALNDRLNLGEKALQTLKDEMSQVNKTLTALRTDVLLQMSVTDNVHTMLGHRSKRSLVERVLFRPSGRPRKFLRRLAFHKNGRPRGGMLGRIVQKKNGSPRRPFVQWLASEDYASLPWPKQQAGRTEGSSLSRLVLSSGHIHSRSRLDDLIGPNPSEHPRRHEILARLYSLRKFSRRA